MRVFYFTTLLFIFLVNEKIAIAQGANPVFTSYQGQSELFGTQSVTLAPGFGIPAGYMVKIFVDPNASTPGVSNPYSNTRTYTLITTYRQASTVSIEDPSPSEAFREIEYMDVLGRPEQRIAIGVSPTGKDLVLPIAYDNKGLRSLQHLPYTTNNDGLGFYKNNALSSQQLYYTTGDTGIPSNAFPFQKTVIESSPLSRVLEKGSPGPEWQPEGTGANNEGHTLKYGLGLNGTDVVMYDVSLSPSNVPSLVRTGVYDENQLSVKITKEENWVVNDGQLRTVEEYRNKDGQVLVTRKFIKVGNAVDTLSTYYVYDNFGRLTYILPPGTNPDGVNVPTTANIASFGYQSQYDKYGRMVEDYAPGVDATYYVYNNCDQIVARQNPNQRTKHEWTVFKYDVHGRQVMTGIWSNDNTAISRTALQTIMDNQTIYWESRNTSTATHGYTNVTWPSNNIHYDVVSYYDNYDIPGLPSGYTFQPYAGNQQINKAMGLETGRKTWLTNGSSTVLWNTLYYDIDARVIQVHAENHLGGKDIFHSVYNFTGNTSSTRRVHQGPSSQSVTIDNTFEYDDADRLVSVRQKTDSGEEITLLQHTYNELGMLVDKKLHRKDGQTKFLQSIDYRYNERGWLTSINDPDLNVTSAMNDGDADSGADLFGIQLSYNVEPAAPQYNGNIAAARWKTSQVVGSQSTAPPKMGYQYRYDELNQLVDAISEKDNIVDNAHNESISYDINGNISTLQRKAYTGGNVEIIDDLAYTYNGYRSKKIDDISTSTHKNLGYHDQAQLPEEHIYDDNGNMIEDKNKNITLEYNDRNLVRKITFGGNPNHTLEFLYDRTGKKLQAKYTYPTGSYTIDYLDGIQYQQGQLAFIHTGEGRARKNGSVYNYEYDLKDHLGNVRVTFIADESEPTQATARVIQQNSYYPYGMPMYGDAANDLHLSFVSGEKSKYLYSDKELYDQGDLNWFDHGSRMYDPATGRWSVMDPAAQFANPYLAMGNNPVIGVDPNGEFFIPILVGAAVGVLANGVSNSFQSKSFFNGWGMAAIMGGIGGYLAVSSSISTMTAGQQALGSGVGVASSYLPGVNIPIGDLGYLSLNPAVAFGGGGFQLGAGAGLSLPWAGGFSIGLGGGASWGKDGFTGNRGWTSSVTGAIGYSDGTNSFSLSTSQFNAPGLRSQTLGTFSYRHKSGFGVGYSNDGAPFDKFGYADPGSDGFRSAALQLSYKELTVGTRIFTGDRNVDVDRPPSPGYPRGTVGNQDAYSYMSSPLFIGYKGMRAGVDDWRVGHGVQNILAHDILKPQAWFRWREHGQNMKLYGGYFSSNNPYILW